MMDREFRQPQIRRLQDRLPGDRHPRQRERSGDGRGKKFVFYLLIAALVSSMVLTYVWTFAKMAEARVHYDLLKKENRRLADRVDELTVEVARLSNPTRIETLAKERLKMALPTGVEFLKIEYVTEEGGDAKAALVRE